MSSSDFSLGVDQTQLAISELEAVVSANHAEEGAGKVGEMFGLVAEAIGNLLVPVERERDVGVGLGNHGEDFVSLGSGKRLGDAAGDDPSRMDAFAAEQFDDVLAKAAEADAGAAKLRDRLWQRRRYYDRRGRRPCRAAGLARRDRRSSARATESSAPGSARGAAWRRWAEFRPT